MCEYSTVVSHSRVSKSRKRNRNRKRHYGGGKWYRVESRGTSTRLWIWEREWEWVNTSLMSCRSSQRITSGVSSLASARAAARRASSTLAASWSSDEAKYACWLFASTQLLTQGQVRAYKTAQNSRVIATFMQHTVKHSSEHCTGSVHFHVQYMYSTNYQYSYVGNSSTLSRIFAKKFNTLAQLIFVQPNIWNHWANQSNTLWTEYILV